MKSKITKVIRRISLILVLSLIALLGLTMTAQAQNPYPISAIKVTNLDQFRGYYLTAYYASGSAVGVSIDPEAIQLKQVYLDIQDRTILDSSILLPAQSISWSGIAKPNILLLIVHRNPRFTWKNGDDSLPQMPQGITTISNNNEIKAISFIYMRALSKLPTDNNTIIFDFGAQFSYELQKLRNTESVFKLSGLKGRS